jgi:photosystem II stability/assembly factor-like uncharacterized protein
MTDEIQDITYSLCPSPDFGRDGICFAARGTGLFRSDDGGRTWQFAYESLGLDAPLPTLDVTLSPDFPSDQTIFAGVPGGILRSFDGGRSWLVATLPSPPPVVGSLVASPNLARDGVLFAGTTEDGVFRSADRGSTWVAWNFGLLDLNVFCVALSPAYSDDETLYVGTETGIFRSTNGGRAWREVPFPMDNAPVLCLAVSPMAGEGALLFAGTESHGLFRSDDGGRRWSPVGADTIEEAVNRVIVSVRSSGELDLLVAAGDRVLVSRDAGQTWDDWQPGLTFEQGVASIAAPQGLNPDAPLLVGLVQGGVLRL